jgi:hypothetical protein
VTKEKKHPEHKICKKLKEKHPNKTDLRKQTTIHQEQEEEKPGGTQE